MPSGNLAGLLYRDSAAIVSLGLHLLGTGVTHKHHLPGKRKGLPAKSIYQQVKEWCLLLKIKKSFCCRNKGNKTLWSASVASSFFFENQPCKHKKVKTPDARDGSDLTVLRDTFLFAEERGKDT